MKSLIFIFFTFTIVIRAQIGIGTTTPHQSAALDISSTNKGFLLPRLNLTGRNDISSITDPSNGLMVVNLLASGTGNNAVMANSIYFWQNSIWQKFTALSEITVFKQMIPYVMKSSSNQIFTATELSGINSNENFEIPITWSPWEVFIDNPLDLELLGTGNIFRIKNEGKYNILSNYSFNPLRSTGDDNANYTTVAFTIMKSSNNATSWTAVAGSALPYDVGVSDQIQTVIIPPTILHLNVNDRIKIIITKPGTATPDYGDNSGIAKKASVDYTKYLRITRLHNN